MAKTLKGSYDRTSGRKALHVVSAWASEHRLLLGQVKVESKTNEITAIPSLLELLDIRGSIITLDAIGTQVAVARQIQAQGGGLSPGLEGQSSHPLCSSDGLV